MASSAPSAFYSRFERHAHGEGLKGHATHYCPGCGHGLAHKYLAEAIEELGIQDRTVAVSPVGCAVFLYYYLDVGNTQAAHGRAPAVALGHKLANPEAVVVSYQGDGDLASIGLAEILQATQMGLPLSFLFINNAIYGMTGGQMAPTTLMGQPTSTSPQGRDRLTGQPLKMAELVAGLDGPVYVERVALFDNKQRMRAKKAIQKALEIQMEGRGLAFVEVLSECPTHLHATPEEAERWVREQMVPVFPLGVKKDVAAEPWFALPRPVFDPEKVIEVLGGSREPVPRFGARFPTHFDARDVAVKFAGAGGDGAQTIAQLTSKAAIHEGFDSTYIPSYGPESRGGTSYADVHIATDEVLSPAAPEPHVLVAFNAPSLKKFAPAVRPGGLVVYDTSVISEVPEAADGVRFVGVPSTEIAHELGRPMVKNVVILGALAAASGLFPRESFLTALGRALTADCALLELNEEAFARGEAAVCEEEASAAAPDRRLLPPERFVP
jgi:2-oxoisovalerate ferredoxin oxidoreductase beta subunit